MREPLLSVLHQALAAILSPLTRGAGGVDGFCFASTAFNPHFPPCQGGPSWVAWRIPMREPLLSALLSVLHSALAAFLTPLTRGAGGVYGFCSASTAFNPPIPPYQWGTELGRLEDAHA